MSNKGNTGWTFGFIFALVGMVMCLLIFFEDPLLGILLGVIAFFVFGLIGLAIDQKRVENKFKQLPPEVQRRISKLKCLSANSAVTSQNCELLNCSLVIKGHAIKGNKIDESEMELCFFQYDGTDYVVGNGNWYTTVDVSFELREVSSFALKYHPSDIRFTGATVGGVTTGGFSEYGNYYSRQKINTGKYQVVCNIGGTKCTVDTLYMPGKLFLLAKKDRIINQFVNKKSKCIELKHATSTQHDAVEYSAMSRMWGNLNHPTTMEEYSRLSVVRLMEESLKKFEAEGVIKWLSTVALNSGNISSN